MKRNTEGMEEALVLGFNMMIVILSDTFFDTSMNIPVNKNILMLELTLLL